MYKKQIIGVVVAAILFVFTASSGMVLEKQSEGFLDYFRQTVNNEITWSFPETDFVGVVQVTGTIMNVGSSTMFTEVEYDHYGIIDYIDQMTYNKNNKGLLLYVDSPGGAVYDVDELYEALMDYKTITNRPVIAYFASYACSGGYYIGMVADEIYANKNSMLGSIGCIISFYNYSELLQKLGVQEVNITSGKNKAMGSGGEAMTEEQKEIFQSVVDETYEEFVDIVALGRDMDKETVRRLADGRIYTAKQALEENMIDSLGSYEDCVNAVYDEFGDDITIYYEEKEDTFYSIFSQLKIAMPKSDSQALIELMNQYGDGGLMYYADLF